MSAPQEAFQLIFQYSPWVLVFLGAVIFGVRWARLKRRPRPDPEELILGKTLPYILICLVTMVMILAVGYFLFKKDKLSQK